MERSKGTAAAADGKSRAQAPRLEGAWLVLSGLTEHWVSDAGALEKDVRCVQGDIKKATKIYILLMLDFKIF